MTQRYQPEKPSECTINWGGHKTTTYATVYSTVN